MMSVMIGGVTERVAPDSNFMIWDNVTNSSIIDVVSRDAERVRVAAAVTFISGLFQVVMFVASSRCLQMMMTVLSVQQGTTFLHMHGSDFQPQQKTL